MKKKSPIHLIADADTTKRIVMMVRRSIGVTRGNATASEFYETHQAEARERLAKLLAGEDINVRHQAGVPSAYFDTQKRELVLPLFKAINYHVINYLLGHEVGHALYTGPQEWAEVVKSKLPGDYYQIVEDVRIEKLIKRKFPGLRVDFSLGSLQFLLTDFFGINKIYGGTEGIQDGSLIDKVCLLFKVNENMGADILDLGFTAEEQAIVDTLYGLETFEEMVKAAWVIYEYDKKNQAQSQIESGDVRATMDQAVRDQNGIDRYDKSPMEGTGKILNDSPKKIEKQLKKNSDTAAEAKSDKAEADAEAAKNASDSNDDAEGEGEGQGAGEDGDEGEGEESQGSAAGSGEDEGEGEGEGQGAGEGGDDDEESLAHCGESGDGEGGENQAAGQGSGGAALNTSGETFDQDQTSEQPKSQVREQMEKGMENLVDIYGKSPLYYKPFKYVLSDVIIPYSKVLKEADDNSGFNIFDNASADHKRHQRPWVNFMVTDFEKKKAATKWLNRKRNTVGKISPKRLYAYKISNEILATKVKFKKGKHHGLVMVIDLSGSMGAIIDSTFKQVINLVNFCRKSHIPHQVYGFSDNLGNVPVGDQFGEAYFEGDNLKMVELFNTNMSLAEVEKMTGVLLSSYYTTPGSNAGHYNCVQPAIPYLHLGGTPLNSAILATRQIVDVFRKTYKVEKMNVIFLTDGGASDGEIEGDEQAYNSYDRYNPKSKFGEKILVDHNSKRQYIAVAGPRDSYNKALRFTPVFIEYLRKETGSKVMNFYIDGVGDLPGPQQAEFKEDGQAWVKDHKSWDGFFAISSEVMATPATVVTDEANTTVEDLGVTRRNDRKSRVILSKFIDIIA